MANYSANDRSERILQNRRFTTSELDLAQEAFTSVLDIGAYEIYTDDGLIPSASSQLPFSGSSQNGLIVSASQVDPDNYTEGVNDLPILKYYYRHRLKRGAVTEPPEEQVFYFTEEEATTSGVGQFVSDNQLIESDQLTNFISPKYLALAGDTVNVAETGNPGGAGYKVVVYVSDSTTASSITEGSADPNNYVFDYKTGVLSWKTGFVPTSTKHVYITAYQYIGRTLRSQIDDGSIGGGSDFTAEGISGSLGPNADLIRSLTAASISGSLGPNASLIRSLTADSISGSFTEASSSFATRVETLEGNEVHTAAAISGSTKFTIAGSDDSFIVGQEDTINFISGSAGLTVLNNSTDTITIGDKTDDVTFSTLALSGSLPQISAPGNLYLDAKNGESFIRLNGSRVQIFNPDTNGASELRFMVNDGVVNAADQTLSRIGLGYNNDFNSLGSPTAEIKVNSREAFDSTTGGSKIVFSAVALTSSSLRHILELDSGEGYDDNFTEVGSIRALSGSKFIGDLTGTASYATKAITLDTDATGTNLTLAGNLTIQGTTTTVNTENLVVEDKFIFINSSSTAPVNEGGIIVRTNTGGSGSAFFYDSDLNRWLTTAPDTVTSGISGINTSNTSSYTVSVIETGTDVTTATITASFGNNSNPAYGAMFIDTDNGDIFIYSV